MLGSEQKSSKLYEFQILRKIIKKKKLYPTYRILKDSWTKKIDLITVDFYFDFKLKSLKLQVNISYMNRLLF